MAGLGACIRFPASMTAVFIIRSCPTTHCIKGFDAIVRVLNQPGSELSLILAADNQVSAVTNRQHPPRMERSELLSPLRRPVLTLWHTCMSLSLSSAVPTELEAVINVFGYLTTKLVPILYVQETSSCAVFQGRWMMGAGQKALPTGSMASQRDKAVQTFWVLAVFRFPTHL